MVIWIRRWWCWWWATVDLCGTRQTLKVHLFFARLFIQDVMWRAGQTNSWILVNDGAARLLLASWNIILMTVNTTLLYDVHYNNYYIEPTHERRHLTCIFFFFIWPSLHFIFWFFNFSPLIYSYFSLGISSIICLKLLLFILVEIINNDIFQFLFLYIVDVLKHCGNLKLDTDNIHTKAVFFKITWNINFHF